jgi:hypothetical protein
MSGLLGGTDSLATTMRELQGRRLREQQLEEVTTQVLALPPQLRNAA